MKSQASVFAIAILLALTLPASAIAANEERLATDLDSGVEAGFGWSDKTQSPTHLRCVAGTASTISWNKRYSQARAVQSTESLYKDEDLNITTKVKARFEGGGGGVSGKYRKFDSTLARADRTNLSFQLFLERDGQEWSADSGSTNFELLPQYKALLLQDKGKQRFYELCGDYFILTVSNRSTVTAIASTSYNSSETRKVVERSIEADGSYGVMSVDVAVRNLKTSINNRSDASTAVTVESSGFDLHGSPDAALNFPTTLEDVERFFKSITPSLLTPLPWKVTIKPYSDLDECSDGGCISYAMESTFDPDALYYERLLAINAELGSAQLDATLGSDDSTRQYLSALHQSMTSVNANARMNAFRSEIASTADLLKPRLDPRRFPCPAGEDCKKALTRDRNDLRWATLVPVARAQVEENALSALLTDPVEQTRLEYALQLWNSRIVVAHEKRCKAMQEYCQPLDYKAELCKTFELVNVPAEACANLNNPIPTPAMLVESQARFIPLPAWQSAVIYDVRNVPNGWIGEIIVDVVDAKGNSTQQPITLKASDFPKGDGTGPGPRSRSVRVHPSSEPRFVKLTGGTYVQNKANQRHAYGDNELHLTSREFPSGGLGWELKCGIWPSNPNLTVDVKIEPGAIMPLSTSLQSSARSVASTESNSANGYLHSSP